MFEPIMQSKYGPLSAKVSLEPDFFTGFMPERRKQITDAEAAFYHSITEPYSVDDRLSKSYISVPARDGFQIPVKVYRPKNETGVLPVFLFMHGGGFITCNPETHDFVPSYIAAKGSFLCFSVDYRLAPEHPFPKGLEDCEDVLLWISEHAEELYADADRIAVGGDSSGGTFTAVLTQMMRDSKRLKLWKQVLIYPATDFSGDISKKSAEVYTMVGSADDGEQAGPSFLDWYLGESADLHDSHVSPLFAKSFRDLPQALFIQAECDALCDDGLIYAKCLQDAGVSVECHLYEGMPHAFILRTYTETFDALDQICAFLQK